MMRSARPQARSIGALGLVVLLTGCGMSARSAGGAQRGTALLQESAYREALAHFRDATRLAPDSTEAQVALGEVAEILGEFEQALSAYQAAARRSPSPETWVRVGRMADRMGNVDLAIRRSKARTARGASMRGPGSRSARPRSAYVRGRSGRPSG